MAGVIGALIGKHLANQEDARNNSMKMVLAPIADRLANPADSRFTPDDADVALSQAITLHYLDKHHGALLKAQLAQNRKQWEAKQQADQLQRDTAPKKEETGGLGVPNMNPGAPLTKLSPTGQPDTGAILQRLLPMLAQGQQGGGAQAGPPPGPAPGAVPPGPGPGVAPSGMPPPPSDGAGAGPAPPPDPKPAMRVASLGGGIGFGGPPATTVNVGSVPKQVMPVATQLAQNGPPRLFPYRGYSANEVAERGAHAKVAGEAITGPAEAEAKRVEEAKDIEARTKLYKGVPGGKDLSSRQMFGAITNKPVTPELAARPVPGLVQGKTAPPGTTDIDGRPLNPETFYARKEDYQGIRYYPATGVTHTIVVKDATSSTGYSQISLDRAQNEIGRERDALPNPGLLPTLRETTVNGVKFVPQADGSYAPVNVQTNTQVVSGKQVPGTAAAPAAPGLPAPPDAGGPVWAPQQTPAGAPGPAPAAAPRAGLPAAPNRNRPAVVGTPGAAVGNRPLTPEQSIKNTQIAEQLNNTIGTIQDIKAKIPMLASMITSGKIALQVDPHQGFFRGIINKNMSLTPDEAELASDWQLLTEGVMQMRIPMGGGGFKGPEGFGAIQSNKGILSQHPEIIQRVLDGTLREFRAQRQALVDAGKKYGFKVDPEYGPGFRKAGGAMPGQITAPPGSEDLLRQMINEHKKK